VGWEESTRAGVDVDEILQFLTRGESSDKSLAQGEGRRPLPSVLPAAAAGNLAPLRDDIEPALTHAVPVIVSPVDHACFDVPYAEPSVDRTQEQMRARAGERLYPAKTVAEFFDWEPARTLGSSPGREKLAGVGGVISAATDFEELSFLLLPRLAGVAHKAWSEPRSNIWSEHRQALAQHRRLWDQDRLTYFETSTVDW
jgi:hexosaminidase